MQTIGIIGALPTELTGIRRRLGAGEVLHKSGFDFYINMLGNKRIVNACCGISKVNAAVCCQAMIESFETDAIINTGIAGGMHSDVKICDIVISSDVLPHDVEPRFLTNYPPYCGIFKADSALIKIACDICEEKQYIHFVGRIVSGEAFISSNEVKNSIIAKYDPHAVDMESAAIGHCCFLNNTPFVSVRCISDNADDQGEMTYDEFENIAAEKVAEVVIDMVRIY